MSVQPQQKVHHLLLIASHHKTSYDVMLNVYCVLLNLGDHIQLYSHQPLGKDFDKVVPMGVNQNNLKMINYMVIIGDNETLMRAIRYYSCKDTPHILGIGNGCSPGLYNYLSYQAKDVTNIFVKKLLEGSLYSQKLMKLNCNINCETVFEVVCQLEIHRDMKEPILILNLYIQSDNKTKVKIGTMKGDGLLISTPMGSYCKSLNLNGPLMSKTMESIMFTAICPLSMKFRPLCLPAYSRIFIEIDPDCRTNYAMLYFDQGGLVSKLQKGKVLRIRTSKYRANLVANLEQSCVQLFIKSLKSAIRWGQNNQSHEMDSILRRSTIEGQYLDSEY